MLDGIQIEDNIHVVTNRPKNSAKLKDEKHYDYIDLTEDTPERFIKPTSKNHVAKSCLQDCLINNNNKFDIEISSVTSWTSSSDDILCSNNSRVLTHLTA